MKKLLTLGLVSASLMAGEFQFGSGTFDMELYGVKKSADITTFSLFEQHKNMFDSNWFYGYDITWNESDDLNFAQNMGTRSFGRAYPSTGNTASKSVADTSTGDDTDSTSADDTSTGGNTASPQKNDTPTTDNYSTNNNTLSKYKLSKYKFQGIDLNIILGKDLIHKSDDDFLGVGLLIGASFPWIDSKDNTDNAESANNTAKKTKTKIMTYKVGPTISGRTSFGKYFMGYVNASYAYQTESVKNDDYNIDQTTNGTYLNYGVGLRFQPFKTEKKLGFVTLKPKLYVTIGYKYSKWNVKDIKFNGATLKTDLKMTSKVAYLGVGYSF